MGLQDRDWYQEELKRKAARQVTNTPASQSEFSKLLARGPRPWWEREWIRLALIFGVVGLLYFAWTQFRG
jgi:hypothetical protein